MKYRILYIYDVKVVWKFLQDVPALRQLCPVFSLVSRYPLVSTQRLLLWEPHLRRWPHPERRCRESTGRLRTTSMWHDMTWLYTSTYIYIIYNHIYLHLCISYICMYIYFYWLHLFTELSTCLARCCGSFGLASIVLVVIHVDELILGTENNITWLTTMVGVWLVVMQWKITIFHEIHYKWPCLIAILT